MYYDDMQFLRKETITNKIEAILSNYALQPHVTVGGHYNVLKDKNILFLTLFYPFDTANTRIILPKNVETHFDKKGFLIIPPSLRNN